VNEIRKIKLDEETLRSGEVAAVIDQLQRAKEIPLVRAVGEDKGSKDSFITVVTFLAVGLLSGVFTWLAWRTIDQSTDVNTANILCSVYLSFCIAISLVLTDTGLTRNIKKVGIGLLIAIPVAGILSYLLGMAASAAYEAMFSTTYQQLVDSGLSPYSDNFWTILYSRNQLNSGMARGIIGLAAGLAVGAHSKSVRRILVTGAGGLVGGFVGGFVFDFVSGGQDAAQITGLAITGGAVGLAVSLLEQATKQSWLEIVKGGMAGKQFILYQKEITIGSSPAANITLIKDPAIAPVAAMIRRQGSGAVIVSQINGVPISVNGQSGQELALLEGAVIVLGGTELRFREKSKKIKNSTIIRS
jgi:hypothetical protein